MNIYIGTKSVHGNQAEVTSKIACVLPPRVKLEKNGGDVLLTNLDKGNPYPNPAIGALKSLSEKSASIDAESIVVYI